MKKLKYISIALTSVLLLASCTNDDSKYGGNNIDEITINGIPEMQEIEIGTNLKVTPDVTTKFGAESDLSYVWYKYNTAQAVADTLSFEKNLDVLIGDVLPGAETALVFKVTDNKTGIFAMHRSFFKTIGRYSGGTLILYRKDSECELAMLKKDGVTFYDNIYTSANQDDKLSPMSEKLILTDGDMRNPYIFKSVIVTAQNETGGEYLDPTIMKRKYYMREQFDGSNEMSATLDITTYGTSQYGDFLIVNGKLHARLNYNETKSYNYVQWMSAGLVLVSENEYDLAPCMIHADSPGLYGAPFVYDNKYNRFMYADRGVPFKFVAGNSHDISKFDPNNLGTGMEMLISGYRNDSTEDIWALMKNTVTNEFELLTYRFIDSDNGWSFYFISESRTRLTQADHPGLYQATNFLSGTRAHVTNSAPYGSFLYGISNIFFYVYDNKVYAFNTNSQGSAAIIDGNTENYTITGINCDQVPVFNSTDPEETVVQLTVYVKDNNVSSPDKGGIAIYNLSSLGGLTAQKSYTKTGFCEEVLHTVEKTD